MTEAKTIKLLLSNGSLSGLLIAELLKWDGILFSSPRETYLELANEKESKYWGVYLLVSDEQVYVGQANDLFRRIKEHNKTKDWWEKVVLFTAKDNSLNRSDVDYLENNLINLASTAGTLEMNNSKIGNLPKVSRYREAELKDFLNGALLLLELIGIKVFKTKKKITKKAQRLNIVKNVDINDSDKTEIIDYVIANDKLNKNKAISLLKEKGFNFTNKVVSYATLQEKKRVFWLNPKTDSVEKEWIVLLNDQFNRKIIVLDIPPYSFSVNGDLINNLIIRKDKPQYIDLNLSEKDLVDVRTRLEFKTYIKEEVKY